MSEPQFNYSGLTLDELRSMAASPQVGSMQAMPQSFRALADRVGEVADLLSHAQADLPNWWKGPAAEQAAATLGRAAAEAREFHGSALATASAVSRCAQVVAEQQHQMMNVPEVPEPGITAVVQRPATPFEALEAARQDATYQAAHQQAVQTVNGIAAQYVETRSQLAAINLFSGEGFSSPESTGQHSAGSFASLNGLPPASIKTDNEAAMMPTGRSSTLRLETSGYHPAQEKTAARGELAANSSKAKFSKLPTDTALSSKAWRASMSPIGSSPDLTGDMPAYLQSLESVETPATAPTSKDPALTSSRRYETPMDANPQPLRELDVVQASTHDASGLGALKQEKITPSNTFNAIGRRQEELHYTTSPKENGLQTRSVTEAASAPRAQPAENHALGNDVNDGNAAMVPPFSGIGSVRNERERRTPRPAYLKERQSTWLPDILATPADGVITPDWFEHL